jgi:hypothetical protein
MHRAIPHLFGIRILLPNIIRVIKSRRMRWAGDVAFKHGKEEEFIQHFS